MPPPHTKSIGFCVILSKRSAPKDLFPQTFDEENGFFDFAALRSE